MRQLLLSLPNTWGGRRPRAGRKRNGPRPGVSHRTRPYHDAAHPAHITLRAIAGLPSLRAARVFPAVRAAIAHAQRGRVFRICHFSVQGNHVHLLVEAAHRDALVRGVQGMTIRMARSVNRTLRRRGNVWGDRYHRRDLRRFAPRGEEPAVRAPRTWLLGVGWRRLGLIASAEAPRGA